MAEGEGMKIGTFACWLVGHKFLWKTERPSQYGPSYLRVTVTCTDYCVRCGCEKLPKEEPCLNK